MKISDQWKQIMLTLPDNYFFELMKNYLGKIQTPFNKHKLVDQLGVFLIKNDAEKYILDNLTEQEILLITSIKFIANPTVKSIYEFFGGEIPFIELCDVMKTLEEKLIIYSDRHNIYISPLFAEGVNNKVLNPGLLYNSDKIDPVSGDMIWLTDSLILSFLSFLFHQKDLMKSGGTFKKRAFNNIEELYPTVFSGENGKERIELVRRVVHNLRLFRIDGNSLIPRDEIWQELSELKREDAWLYFAGAASSESLSNINDNISTIKKIIETLPVNRSFYPDNLKKLIKALSSGEFLNDNNRVSEFIDDLICLNILKTLEDGTITKNPFLDLNNLNPDYGDKKTVIVQPNFDITFKPWITLKDGYTIALFTELKKMDMYSEYHLTKESVNRGLTMESLESFISAAERITGQSLHDNVEMTLKEWENESKKALHYEASVLILDEDKDFIVKETRIIEDLILLNPAPGIYLISPENYKKAQLLLGSVDIYPIDKNHSTPTESISLPKVINTPTPVINWEKKEIVIDRELKKELEKSLRSVTGSKEEIEDLKKRIDRGIIFNKDQIQPGITKTDFSEAKGINYQAKLRLIEVSLKSVNDRLEINYVEDLTIKKELILPKKIEKQGETRILHGIKLPQEIEYSIDISKISLVKRIQTTLF